MKTDVADPLTDPATLARALAVGVLDAPHLHNNSFARGEIQTRIDSRGACVAIDPKTGKVLPEQSRIASLVSRSGSGSRFHPKRPVSTR